MSAQDRANGGFISTTSDHLVNAVRSGSMWPMAFGLACCAVEMMHAAASKTQAIDCTLTTIRR